jgi:hypothetical protein
MATQAERTPRELASRETEKRYEYTPAASLPEPKPDPMFSYRWVATHVMGTLDPVNASKRFRDGWEPVKAVDHPELFLPGNADGNVEIGGLMLCRMPKERALARQRYFDKQNEQQMESVDGNYMRNSDSRMPLFSEKSSEVTRGGGFGKGPSR